MEIRVEFLKSSKVTHVNYTKLGTGPKVYVINMLKWAYLKSVYFLILSIKSQ